MNDLLGEGMFAPILPSDSLYPNPSLKKKLVFFLDFLVESYLFV